MRESSCEPQSPEIRQGPARIGAGFSPTIGRRDSEKTARFRTHAVASDLFNQSCRACRHLPGGGSCSHPRTAGGRPETGVTGAGSFRCNPACRLPGCPCRLSGRGGRSRRGSFHSGYIPEHSPVAFSAGTRDKCILASFPFAFFPVTKASHGPSFRTSQGGIDGNRNATFRRRPAGSSNHLRTHR